MGHDTIYREDEELRRGKRERAAEQREDDLRRPGHPSFYSIRLGKKAAEFGNHDGLFSAGRRNKAKLKGNGRLLGEECFMEAVMINIVEGELQNQ